jgi:hypothetical protein
LLSFAAPRVALTTPSQKVLAGVERKDHTHKLLPAEVAERRWAARASPSTALREIEADQAYDTQQEFLATAALIAKEGRLSRLVYVFEKMR